MRKPKREDYANGAFSLGNREGDAVADFRDEDGKRRRARLGVLFSQTSQAKAALDRFAEAQRAVQKQQAAHTVGQLWAMWLQERAADKLDNGIYAANWVSLAPVFASRAPHLLVAQDFRDYATKRFDAGRSSWTVHTELVRLRACLKWAAEAHHIAERPKVWVPSPGKHRDRVLSIEEARRLVAGAGQGGPHILLFVILAFNTGARHKAILDLTWDRIDFVRGMIDFEDDLPRDPMSKSWRKGRALVPMNIAARKALDVAFEGRQTKWVVEHGGRRIQYVRRGFTAACRRAGLSGVTPHTIRHTVASWLEDRVNDARRAQLLGHDGTRTLPVYTHPGAELLNEAVSLLDAEFAPLPKIAESGDELQAHDEPKSAPSVPTGQNMFPQISSGTPGK